MKQHLKTSLYALTASLTVGFAQTAPAQTVPSPDRIISSHQVESNSRTEKFNGFSRMPVFRVTDGKVNFTAGDNSLAPAVTYDFNSDMQGWIPDQAQNVSWSVKAGTHNFNEIDPSSTKSLFVEGPYQTFKRETSSITSPSFDVPELASLSFYIGYSLNYNDVCSLVLSISTDGFETSETLWDSTEQTGEKPWAWRPFTVDLSDFSGKSVQLRFTYGPGTDDMFQTGGYLGDFYIDNVIVSGRKAIDNIAVLTGETIRLVPLVDGEYKSCQWSMPGAVPSVSDETNPVIYYTADGNYDISLTVTMPDDSQESVTKTGFVTVTGTAPTAHIIPPATFRYSETRLPMVAPMMPVTFTDGSEGFPTAHSWVFTGVDEDSNKTFTSESESPQVRYNFLHRQMAGLEVSNTHGSSSDTREVSVEYSGVINNLEPTDVATTFSMDDWGFFPGSNTRNITAYAEKFSKPSRPILINGVYAFFTRTDAGQLVDQIANVGVHIYSSENGLPGQKLESWWWNVVDLDGPSASGDVVGTSFPITPPVVMDDEFFVVVDGIPSYKEANGEDGVTAVTLGMAQFRDHGNTAYMLKDGQWVDVSTYFPAGANHTSLMVYPSIIHSVIAPLPYSEEAVEVSGDAGTLNYPFFSIMGWGNGATSDSQWLRVTNTPNDMTVDELVIEYDAIPAGGTEREGHITVSDGVSQMLVTVKQNKPSGVTAIGDDSESANAPVYTIDGRIISTDINNLAPGIYIRNGKKIIVK